MTAGTSADVFAFGENWTRFLRVLDEDRLQSAERSLQSWLGEDGLRGKAFLDAGCGSGLFSLAAARLGASRVLSFDADPRSVACGVELKRRFAATCSQWSIERGSVLDGDYMQTLGRFDVVYSWGVLHHTGHLWRAFELVSQAVVADGRLWVAVYNDQGLASQAWTLVKRLYNALPPGLRWLVVAPAFARLWGPALVRDAAVGNAFRTWSGYGERGMSPWTDVIDWVGGYPFEVASPGQVVAAGRRLGFDVERLKTCGGGRGCNEFLLQKRGE